MAQHSLAEMYASRDTARIPFDPPDDPSVRFDMMSLGVVTRWSLLHTKTFGNSDITFTR